MMYKFNQKEIKKILDSLVIIVDTRENANSHIIDFFNNKKIPYSIEKLPFRNLVPLCFFQTRVACSSCLIGKLYHFAG